MQDYACRSILIPSLSYFRTSPGLGIAWHGLHDYIIACFFKYIARDTKVTLPGELVP